MRRFSLFLAVLPLLCGMLLTGCASNSVKTEAKYPTGDRPVNNENNIYAERESVFGPKGLKILGGADEETEDNGIGVNGFLWRASLDTVSFMPLASADPFGGVIITDWYSPDENKFERFKLNIFITDRQLKADGIKVSVFKQSRKRGQWVDEATPEDMARELEDTILTRARQLRIAKLDK